MKNLFKDPQLRRLCRDALEDSASLETALEELYCRGFSDAPHIEGAQQHFARRAVQMRREYARQLESFRQDSEAWEQAQLETVPDPDQLVCATTALAARLHAEPEEEVRCSRLLETRMQSPCSPEENKQLLHRFVTTPMTGLFSFGSIPELLRRQLPQAAELLAMGSYARLKHSADLSPELSFDAVCILSSAVVEVLCGDSRKARQSQEAAVVAGVMAAEYMHVFEWEVLRQCMRCLPELIRSVITRMLEELADLIREVWNPRMIAAVAGVLTAGQIAAAAAQSLPGDILESLLHPRREKQGSGERISFEPWLRLLRSQIQNGLWAREEEDRDEDTTLR